MDIQAYIASGILELYVARLVWASITFNGVSETSHYIRSGNVPWLENAIVDLADKELLRVLMISLAPIGLAPRPTDSNLLHERYAHISDAVLRSTAKCTTGFENQESQEKTTILSGMCS